MNKSLTATNGNDEFYPTPKSLAGKILAGLDWNMIQSILEPSAGKGDLLDEVKERHKALYDYYRREFESDIDCIEIDSNLRHILRGKGYRVVHDDFLTFETFKRYDLIIMNPPFSNGDKHLLKALKMQERGGNIICILNAETIKNPYTNTRKELVKVLDEHSAQIEYIKDAFTSAERATGVEIAVIKVHIPQVVEESDIYDHMRKAKKLDEVEIEDSTDITMHDYIKAAVARFNVETAAGIELIRQYKNMVPYMSCAVNPDDAYKRDPMLKLTLDGDKLSINTYLEKVRLKYWEALFANPKFTMKLTSKMESKYRSMVNDLKNYDFSEYNIEYLIADMNANVVKGIEETIIEMFDKLTTKHSWWAECNNNVHYYDGWAHNKAHKINKKVILPCYGAIDTWCGRSELRTYHAMDILQDIEKVLNFLDGGMTREVDLRGVLEAAKTNPTNIECKFFKVTFYKKGTVHITFTNLDLLEKFNIYAAQNKKWLPPDYGKKPYNNMSESEKAVVDSFQGKEAYDKVIRHSNYYLMEAKQMLQITG